MTARRVGPGLTLLLLGLLATEAEAQAPRPDRERADLVVEGVVRDLFRSALPEANGQLVMLEVRRSELGKGSAQQPLRILVPAPGDLTYVHVADGRIPEPRSSIRASLVVHPNQGWANAGPDWFERLAPTPADEPFPVPTEPPPTAPATVPKALERLGIAAEELSIKGRTLLRVTSVQKDTPAARAGLEPGDVLVMANGAPVGGIQALSETLNRAGPRLELTVADVNSGRLARVDVALTEAPAETKPAPPSAPGTSPTPVPASPRRPLGLSADPVSIGSRTALKITRITPGSPAEKAGLEVGDVIVAANGTPVTGAEPMSAAIRLGGPVLKLTVRDVRTGRDTPVDVELAPAPAAPSAPTAPPTPISPGQGNANRLGIVGELVFTEDEAAVKITEVVPNSPAARAGLAPGDVVLAANGKKVLHPDALTEAVAKAGPTIDLEVIRARDQGKGSLQVNLGP